MKHVWPALVLMLLLPVDAEPPTGPLTSLDQRRKTLLEVVDQQFNLGAADPMAPSPNLTLQNAGTVHQYQDKVTAIYGLVDMGIEPTSRIAEANQLLRYAWLHEWPATGPGSVSGQYATAWNHRDRVQGVRLYYLYYDWMDADLQADLDNRMSWSVQAPQNSSSENIKFTNNQLRFLAHEATGQTGLSTYTDCKNWLINSMKGIGNDGPHEWARHYWAWTLGSILNLAEFAEDNQVKTLATMVVDHYLAELSGFVLDNGNYASGAVRMWSWPYSTILPQATIAKVLFTGNLAVQSYNTWTEWAVSNYRPLNIVSQLYGNTGSFEAKVRSGSADWRHRTWRGNKYLLATNNATEANNSYFVLPSGGTHNIVGAMAVSRKNPQNVILPYGYTPGGPPSKQRCQRERYFGYKNAAFVHHGGTINAVWAGGVFNNKPIRCFYYHNFSLQIQNGWAFFNDGEMYAAWNPTQGNPVSDTATNQTTTGTDSGGKWVVSSYTPDANGEVAILEVGDAAEYGSYNAFKNDVIARNPNPSWNGSSVTYVAKDGATIVFTNNSVSVNGQGVNLNSWPRAQMPGVNNFSVTAGGSTKTFNFNAISTTGPTGRMASNMTFGISAPAAIPAAVLPGRFEAEDYKVGGEMVGYHDTTAGNAGSAYRNDDVDIQATTDSGGGYNVGWTSPGEWLAYDVTVGKTTEFEIALRVASGVASNRIFHVEIDGVDVTGPMTFAGGAGWQTWQEVSATATLTAGPHELRVVFDNGSANLNWIEVRPAVTILPGVLEAEDYRLGGPGVGFQDTTPGNTGGAYRNDDVDLTGNTTDCAIGWIAPNEWTSYRIDVQQTDTYDVTARVASAAVGTKSFHIEVDGVDVSGPLQWTDASGWGAWIDVTFNGISLDAGPHEMRIVMGPLAFNLNYLQFDVATGGGGTTTGGGGTTTGGGGSTGGTTTGGGTSPPAPAGGGGGSSRCGLMGIEPVLLLVLFRLRRRRRSRSRTA